MNVGSSVTNINVLANGVSTFIRDISIGGSQFTDAIQKALNVSYDEAEALKLGGGAELMLLSHKRWRECCKPSGAIANEVQRSRFLCINLC